MRAQLATIASRLGMGRMTDGEYRANLSGINMFFGAVLGVVLGGIEKLDQFQFGVVLVLLATIVTTIMFISGSRHRMAYAVYAILMTLATPRLIDALLKTSNALPAKVMPTLLAWTLMTILVEFWARERAPPADPGNP